MATVLIGVGFETVKAALEAGHSVRALPEELLLTTPNWKKWPATRSRQAQ